MTNNDALSEGPTAEDKFLKFFRYNIFLFFASAWIVGILLSEAGFRISMETGFLASLIFAGLAFAAFRRKNFALFIVSAVLPFILLANAWASFVSERESPRDIAKIFYGENLAEETVQIEGVLRATPLFTPKGAYLEIEVEKLNHRWRAFEPVEGTVRIFIAGKPERLRNIIKVAYKDKARLYTTLSVPRSYNNESAFDYGEFLSRRGIKIVGYTRSPYVVKKIKDANIFYRIIGKARRGAEGSITRHFSAGDGRLDREGGILLALATGNRANLDPETKRKFQISGTFHVLAISGLHIAIVAFGVMRGGRLLMMGNRAGALLAISACVFLVLFVEARASVWRSALMAMVFFGGYLIYRKPAYLNLLSLSALVILVLYPRDLFDAGFQLTFVATLALIVLAVPLAKMIKERPLQLNFLLAMSVAAHLATMPILLQTFNRITWWGLFFNLWIVPLMGFLMILLSLFLLIAPWSSFLGMIFEAMLRSNLFLISAPIEWIREELGLLTWRTPSADWWLVALYYSALLALSISFQTARFRKQTTVIFLIILIAVQVAPILPRKARNELECTILDVGQGQSVVVDFPDRSTMVIDAGGVRGGRFDTGEHIVSPYLWRKNIRKIDWLVASAPKADHTYGLESVMKNFKVGELWLPEYSEKEMEKKTELKYFEELKKSAARRKIPVRQIGAPYFVRMGDAEARLLYPAKSDFKTDKDDAARCFVISISYGDRSVLFTSDIKYRDEWRLLGNKDALPHSAMTAPLHGSAGASSENFLNAVSPRVAFISVGRNGWGWPSEKTLERYDARNIKVFRTDKDGMIKIHIYQKGWLIEPRR